MFLTEWIVYFLIVCDHDVLFLFGFVLDEEGFEEIHGWYSLDNGFNHHGANNKQYTVYEANKKENKIKDSVVSFVDVDAEFGDEIETTIALKIVFNFNYVKGNDCGNMVSSKTKGCLNRKT